MDVSLAEDPALSLHQQLTLEVFRLQAGSWVVDGLFQKVD